MTQQKNATVNISTALDQKNESGKNLDGSIAAFKAIRRGSLQGGYTPLGRSEGPGSFSRGDTFCNVGCKLQHTDTMLSGFEQGDFDFAQEPVEKTEAEYIQEQKDYNEMGVQ
jgi:hypothetical protein